MVSPRGSQGVKDIRIRSQKVKISITDSIASDNLCMPLWGHLKALNNYMIMNSDTVVSYPRAYKFMFKRLLGQSEEGIQ